MPQAILPTSGILAKSYYPNRAPFVPDLVMLVAGTNATADHRNALEDVVNQQSWQVQLVPEPDNPYDEYAIQILINGQRIGYVPRRFCEFCGKTWGGERKDMTTCPDCDQPAALPDQPLTYLNRAILSYDLSRAVVVQVDWTKGGSAVWVMLAATLGSLERATLLEQHYHSTDVEHRQMLQERIARVTPWVEFPQD